MQALTVKEAIDLLNENHKPDDLLVITWWSEKDTPEQAREGAWDEGLAEEFAGDYGSNVIEVGNDLLDMSAEAYSDNEDEDE